MLEIKSFDLKSILMLSIFKIVTIVVSVIIYISDTKDIGSFMCITICLALILSFSLLQFFIYLRSLKSISISNEGITVRKKTDEKTIPWEKIKLFAYYNEIIILEPNTLKVVCTDDTLLSGEYVSDIHVTLKKYKQAIQYIPRVLLEKDDLLLYETTYLREIDKYDLYK